LDRYIKTMNSVFERGGGAADPDAANNLMRLVAEGTGEDDAADVELRGQAAESYLSLLSKPNVPDVLVQVT
jgi:AP-4 complex subunit epsilon-1